MKYPKYFAIAANVIQSSNTLIELVAVADDFQSELPTLPVLRFYRECEIRGTVAEMIQYADTFKNMQALKDVPQHMRWLDEDGTTTVRGPNLCDSFKDWVRFKTTWDSFDSSCYSLYDCRIVAFEKKTFDLFASFLPDIETRFIDLEQALAGPDAVVGPISWNMKQLGLEPETLLDEALAAITVYRHAKGRA